MNELRVTARITGIWYLLMGITTGFSLGYVDHRIYLPDDPVATMSNILHLDWLIRLGVMSSILGMIFFLLLANNLYKMFASVDKNLTISMVSLIYASIPITCTILTLQLAAIQLSNSVGKLSGFSAPQVQSLAMLIMNTYQNGIYIAGVFWGLWMLPFGILVIKSNFIPKVFGVLLFVGGLGYLANSFVNLLIPNFKSITSIGPSIGGVAEIVFIIWLFIKGISMNDRS